MSLFRSRFPVAEMARLGPQLQGAVKEHAAGNKPLVDVAAELADVSGKLGSLSRPTPPSVLGADENRDEMVRAFALLLESATHRVDKPELQAAAKRLIAALLADGYSWVNAPLGVESKKIVTLLTDAATPKVAADVALVGGKDCLGGIDKYQKEYLEVERGRGAAVGVRPQVTVEERKLTTDFNLTLDLYIARVQKDYKLNDTATAGKNAALLRPILDASGRERGQDGGKPGAPTGGGGSATAPAKNP